MIIHWLKTENGQKVYNILIFDTKDKLLKRLIKK